MVITTSERSRIELPLVWNLPRIAFWVLSAAAVLYAFLAGFHTVQDFDLGWQLATGRWMVEHHRVFSTDVFSCTAAGQPWIYPPLSGVIFYLTYLLGGYGLLSWMGALGSALSVGLLCFNHEGPEGARRKAGRNLVIPILAIVAAPLIASRTQPRAEMFTTILCAAFLTLLWWHYSSERGALWLLPILMALWVNLHPGFVAGLALCAAYALMEILELPFVARRAPALLRLRRAWPWLALTAGATLVNPWGPFIYGAVLRQQRAQALHNLWIVEWEGVPLSWAALRQALDWRDPQSSFWWLLVLAVIGVVIGLWKKQWGAVLLLAGAIYFGLQHVRLQALFACVVVVAGGTLLGELILLPLARVAITGTPKDQENSPSLSFRSEARNPLSARSASGADEKQVPRRLRNDKVWLGVATVLGVVIFSLCTLRSGDLISNRYYLRFSQRSTFGAGLSWWFPERALDFVAREKLPANIFNGYALGGYLTWRLFPAYRDYIDSRALPFGPELFFRAYDLSTEPPDSAAWLEEANARGINTIVVPLSRYQGMSLFPQLHAFCRSDSWHAVYLDEVSAVFVRGTEENGPLIARLQIDCEKAAFSMSDSMRSTVSSFNYAANAGGVLYSLERYPEALAQLDRAESIFTQNASVHLLRGLVFQQLGRMGEAEGEFRTSLALDPTDEAWFDFGLFYMTQRRYAEAAEIFRKSAETSSRPHEMWMMLGQAYVQARQPEQALAAFDRSVESSPFGEDQALGASFNSLVAAGRANAWYQLGDLQQAVQFQEEAVRLAPEDAALWRGLADLYEVQGRTTKAEEARSHAQSVRAH